ncbi:IclR family transcriptional regulator [Algihabitans sp.]|uniref:IclR family transcriptional regulator n=1 Tax=Algihabitans sp. TaxID=2821514 RepID=UPI003BA86AD2
MTQTGGSAGNESAESDSSAGGDTGRGRGVQAVETSVRILRAVAQGGGPLSLSDIAARVGMAPAKVHRYMASFIQAGMIDHRGSGRYDLGPVAAEIGMAAVARVDVVNRAADGMAALVDETGCTAMLSVWGTRGPTVVRWERAATPLVSMLGIGSVLPVTRSATGQAFLAYLPDRVVEEAVRHELGPDTKVDTQALRRAVRARGLATADQDYIPGLYAMARPVLDLQGNAAAVITLISTDRALLDEDGPVWRRMLAWQDASQS